MLSFILIIAQNLPIVFHFGLDKLLVSYSWNLFWITSNYLWDHQWLIYKTWMICSSQRYKETRSKWTWNNIPSRQLSTCFVVLRNPKTFIFSKTYSIHTYIYVDIHIYIYRLLWIILSIFKDTTKYFTNLICLDISTSSKEQFSQCLQECFSFLCHIWFA